MKELTSEYAIFHQEQTLRAICLTKQQLKNICLADSTPQSHKGQRFDESNNIQPGIIIFRGKVYWIRAKEVPGWTPDLEVQGMENSLSKRRSEGLSSRVLEDAQPLNEHVSPSIDSKKNRCSIQEEITYPEKEILFMVLNDCKKNQSGRLVDLRSKMCHIDKVWDLNGEGVFRVKDVRILLNECFLLKAPTATRWVKYVPVKNKCFCLEGFPGSLLRSNFTNSSLSIVSDLLCPLCSSATRRFLALVLQL
ncbi:hypothetical protein Tco_1377653 [Tanacetum coccineum]